MAFPIFAQLVSIAGKMFVAIAAFRIFLITLIVVVLPIVLNNLLYDLIEASLGLVHGTFDAAGIPSVGVQITGVGAYLATQLGLVDAFTIVTTFVTIKFALKMIPFSPFK